jgi:tetratricopeptide (TPR) repeat protein
MTLTDIWTTYSSGDNAASLRQSVEALVESSGIDLLHIAGLSMMNMRRRDEAIHLLKAAITLRPQSSHIYINAAFLTEQAGMAIVAGEFADAGLVDFPDNTDLLMLKANSLVMQLHFTEAAVLYKQILEYDPNHVQSMINMGNIARANEDIDEARTWFARAKDIDPDLRDLLFAHATMETQIGETTKAKELLESIPHDVDAQFLLSLLYLADGDYDRGFRLYRSRCNSVWFRTGNFVYPLKPFDHYTETAGKNIAVVSEGGLGDMIQFVRYIPMLAEVAESITLYTPASLIPLFHDLPKNVTCVSSHSDYNSIYNAFDYITSDAEMPYSFRTTLETIPNRIPYLSVPEHEIERRRLPSTSRMRVGLCWAGGERDGINQRSYDDRRSFDLATYLPLAQLPGIDFVSLQVGPRSEQTDLQLLRLLDDSSSFLDTAAIIMQLDLVITVDTSVVHLAAALGKPVWLLSRYDCCWRWLHNREDSPWYPGVLRVFGQKKYRDWSQPIAEVTKALRDLERTFH